MNFFAFSGLTVGLGTIFSAAIILINNPRSGKNRLFAAYCLAVAGWGFFYCAWQMSDNRETALFFSRALMACSSWIPILHFHFFKALFSVDENGNLRMLRAGYSLALILSTSNLTPLFIAGVEEKLIFPFWPTPGPFFHLYVVYFFFFLIAGFGILFRFAASVPSSMRRDIYVIGSAVAVAYAAGAANQPLWYDIPVIPYYNVLIPVFFVTMVAFMLRHQLLDVTASYKRISLILLIYGLLLTMTLPMIHPALTYAISRQRLDPSIAVLLLGILLGLILSMGPVIFAYFVRRSFWFREHLSMGLAHELKSPLSGIRGAAEILKDVARDPHASQARAGGYIDLIERNADRLERYIGDLLTTIKISRGNVDLIRRPVNMTSLINEVVEHHQDAARRHGTVIDYTPNGSIPVHADPDKLGQVLSNLIGNAVRFTRNGHVRINVTTAGNRLTCSVSDSGSGIDRRSLPFVFDRFVQGRNANKGSGLGLAIAKAWVEAHGGRIWAESEGEGKGTTVTFTVPV